MKKFLTVMMVLAVGAFGITRGHDAGNGGFTVQCDHDVPAHELYEVLDYHEIRTKYPAGTFTLDLGGKGTEWDRIRYVLTRLSRLDPKRAAAYQETVDHFEENALHKSHVDLPNSLDIGAAFLESGCHTVGTVLQFQKPLPGQRKYLISDDVFRKLSEDGKAGLILHEIIYGELLAHGAENSMTARYFNAVVSSAQLASMSADDYASRLAAIGLGSEPHSAPIWTTDPIDAGTVTAGATFSFDLSPYASSPGGGALTFSLESAPSWLNIMGSVLSGTPGPSDVGAMTVIVTATDSQGNRADARVVLVVKSPSAHVHWTQNPIDLGLTYYNHVFSISLANFLVGDGVTFSLKGAPAWTLLSANGQLFGSPTQADVGAVAFDVIAQQGDVSAVATVHLKVIGAQPPVWANPHLEFTAKVGQVFCANVANDVHDADGQLISFSIDNSSLPPWLKFSPDGTLCGTPTDAGVSQFTVRACNPSACSEASVKISVVRL